MSKFQQQPTKTKKVLSHPSMGIVKFVMTNGEEAYVNMHFKEGDPIVRKMNIDANSHSAWSEPGATKAEVSRKEKFFAKFAPRNKT